MKFLLTAIVFSYASMIYAANSQDCLKIIDSIDRKYCVDKYLQSVKEKLNAEKKTWSTGISAETKAAKTSEVEQEIQAKKDYAALINAEVSLNEKYLEELKVAAITAAPAPVAEAPKKKKKKSGFRIKL